MLAIHPFSRNLPLLEPQPTVANQLGAAWRQLRYSLSFRLGATYFSVFLTSLTVMALLSVWLYTRQTEITLGEYGNTVAQQLAQSSVDAVARGDLVSLHAQLEKLTEVDSILEAAVYDMTNHVLAEAGERPDHLPDSAIRHFPAMITFQDSIAGKVIISLNAQTILKQKGWLYGYLICSLIIALCLTIFVSKLLEKRANSHYGELVDHLNQVLNSTSTLQPLEQTSPSWRELISSLDNLHHHIEDLEQLAPVLNLKPSTKYAYKPTEGSYAALLIECINLEQLQQQLHHRELQQLLENLQEQLQKTIKLYHGINIHSPGNHVLLRFLVNDVTDASLQAICCAVLLMGLLKANPAENSSSITLDLRFIVHWHSHDERPLSDLLRNHLLEAEYREILHLVKIAKPGEILTTKGIKQSAAVAEHIKLDLISGDSDADYYRVQRISDSYKKLLEQQIQQLGLSVIDEAG